jgi:serine/threonine protein kinase
MALDHYAVRSLLRADGHRSVWLAQEAILDRPVNIHLCHERERYQQVRFERAMSILSRLDHPAFARYVGCGYLAGAPYLVTEHVNGPTLEELSAQGGRLRELHALRIVHQIADGFDQAWNRAKIIHRDLKPGSILVDLTAMQEDGRNLVVKVTDFGHALGQRLVDQYEFDLAMEEEDFQRATLAERVGSPLCMSPEQVLGRELTASSDMYSLGVTLFLLLAGHPPFSGDDDALRQQHVKAQAPNLPGDISSGMRGLVRRLLTKLPDRRFDSWAHLRDQAAALIRLQEPRTSRRSATESPTTGIRYRQSSQAFECTPTGQSYTLPQDRSEATGQPSLEPLVQVLNRLAATLPPAPVGQPLQQPAVSIASSDATPGHQPTPSLSSEQMAILWSHLFSRLDTQHPAPAIATPPPEPAETSIRILAPAVPAPTRVEPEAVPSPVAPTSTNPLMARSAHPAGRPSIRTETPAAPVSATPNPPEAAEEPWSVRQAVLEALAMPMLRPASGDDQRSATGITRRFTNRLKRLLGDREQILLAIRQALANADGGEALRLIDRLAETSGNDAELCLLRARIAGLHGEWEAMIDWAQQAIVQKVGDPLALATVAFGNLQCNQERIAEVIARNLAESNPDSPLGALCQAGTALILGRQEDAATHLSSAEAINPEHPALILLSAAWWRVAGETSGESAALMRYQQLHGVVPAIESRLARLGCY